MNTKSVFGNKYIWLLLLTFLIVICIQFTLLGDALKIGFKPDDWILYFTFKSLGSNPLLQLDEIWKERGIYTTYQIYYMGLLDNVVSFNYSSFQSISLFLKSLATLAVFPLVIVLFKNTLLAFFATIIFAILPSSIGPLEFVVKGSDYLAIFWMCLFLISYSIVVLRYPRKISWLLISFFLLILSVMFSPIRMFPILILIFFIDICLLISKPNSKNVKNILIRFTVFYMPIPILLAYAPDSVAGILGIPLGILSRIQQGNWHLLLAPFSGIGYTFPTNGLENKIFGTVNLNNFNEYIIFLLGGPTIIFGSVTLLLSYLISKKPKGLFLKIIIFNFLVEVIVFFMANNSKFISSQHALQYDSTQLYASFIGLYITILGIVCFLEYLHSKERNTSLLAFILGSLFLFIFTFFTWAFGPFGTSFSSTSYYLVVSSVGTSIVIASLFALIIEKAKSVPKYWVKVLFYLLPVLVVLLIINAGILNIRYRFSELLSNGRSSEGQLLLQERFKEKIKGADLTKPSLFYFDTSEIQGDGPFYSEGFLVSFPFWMHFTDHKLSEGCLEVFYESREKLATLVQINNKEKGFSYRGVCIENGQRVFKQIHYNAENFYAFRIKNMEFEDIKKDVLYELGFEEL